MPKANITRKKARHAVNLKHTIKKRRRQGFPGDARPVESPKRERLARQDTSISHQGDRTLGQEPQVRRAKDIKGHQQEASEQKDSRKVRGSEGDFEHSSSNDTIFTAPERFPTLKKVPGRNSSTDSSEPDIQQKQFCSWINIWTPGDHHQENGQWEIAGLDTAADNSIVFASTLRKLGIEYYGNTELGTYLGLSNGPVKCIGSVPIRFSFSGMPKVCYEANIDVLEDEPDSVVKPRFNLLIGKPVLIRYGLVNINREKMPHAFFVTKCNDEQQYVN